MTDMDTLAMVAAEVVSDAAIVTITGEVDLSNTDEVEKQVHEAAHGHERVLLDLCGVTYFDSAGMRFLFDLANRYALELCVDSTTTVRRALDVVGIGALVPVHDRPARDVLG